MAMDKSKENSRIKTLIYMSHDALKINIIRGIKNPAILKHFLSDEAELNSFSGTKYAMAAGLIDGDDVEWLKEHEEEIRNEISNENTGNGRPGR